MSLRSRVARAGVRATRLHFERLHSGAGPTVLGRNRRGRSDARKEAELSGVPESESPELRVHNSRWTAASAREVAHGESLNVLKHCVRRALGSAFAPDHDHHRAGSSAAFPLACRLVSSPVVTRRQQFGCSKQLTGSGSVVVILPGTIKNIGQRGGAVRSGSCWLLRPHIPPNLLAVAVCSLHHRSLPTPLGWRRSRHSRVELLSSPMPS